MDALCIQPHENIVFFNLWQIVDPIVTIGDRFFGPETPGAQIFHIELFLTVLNTMYSL